jgi:hypothetical protein
MLAHFYEPFPVVFQYQIRPDHVCGCERAGRRCEMKSSGAAEHLKSEQAA